ncbi:MAG: SRPBCC family protein [Bacillus sp. (in: firmicutes)]|jgi:uncharacterized protein YndB with AHSA1/START domain
MNNLTKFIILKPANEVFEAFVDPSKIGNFWFSSSSERWGKGKVITLRYDEYNAEVVIKVLEIQANEKIVFSWGEDHLVTITLNESENGSTIIEVNEEGFKEDDDELINKLIDNKEGWVYMLSCLKAYMEFGVTKLRAGIVKN